MTEEQDTKSSLPFLLKGVHKLACVFHPAHNYATAAFSQRQDMVFEPESKIPTLYALPFSDLIPGTLICPLFLVVEWLYVVFPVESTGPATLTMLRGLIDGYQHCPSLVFKPSVAVSDPCPHTATFP